MDGLSQKAAEQIFDGYLKILYIDFNTRRFTAIKVPEYEKEIAQAETIDDYWSWFISSELIYEDDKNKVGVFIDNAENTVIYRRKFDDVYKFVVMNISENLLTVKEIDEIYKKELPLVIDEAQRIDAFTGCLNHKAFDDDIKRKPRGNIGVMYIDINGLKWINDHKGHSAGDSVIKETARLLTEQFPAYKIYRLGGDEFAVVAFNVKSRIFIHTSSAFHRRIWNSDSLLVDGCQEKFPVVSIGYSADRAEDVQEIIEDAERQMYEDKLIFYSKYPHYKR